MYSGATKRERRALQYLPKVSARRLMSLVARRFIALI